MYLFTFKQLSIGRRISHIVPEFVDIDSNQSNISMNIYKYILKCVLPNTCSLFIIIRMKYHELFYRFFYCTALPNFQRLRWANVILNAQTLMVWIQSKIQKNRYETAFYFEFNSFFILKFVFYFSTK